MARPRENSRFKLFQKKRRPEEQKLLRAPMGSDAYLFALAALNASISIGVTLNRSPQMP